MVKECLKKYLDMYFELYKKHMGTYPTVPYDEDEISSLWIGEMDEEEYIQWMYKEKESETDFSTLESELGFLLPDELKEFYNSYYFLQLQGFYNGENVNFDNVSDCRDIVQDLKGYLSTIEGKKYMYMGIYSSMVLNLCMEIDTGKMVCIDCESENVELLTDSLGELIQNMTPTR